MRVTLGYARRGDSNKLSPRRQVFDCRATRISHCRSKSSEHLVDHLAQRPAVRHPALNAFGDELPDVVFCILEIPLLVETGRHRDMACVVVVHCPRAIRIARLETSRGMTSADVERIMAQQATDRERLAAADFVIHNDGELVTLRSRVDRVFNELVERFG